MREIAFDTETTGLEWDKDDRIIELGAVEMVNHVATGRTFRALVNPGRPVSAKTVEITGITDEMLADKPAFEAPEIVAAFLAFVGDAALVAHNAAFDRGFLNAELARCGRPPIPEPRWIDTVALARRKFPGGSASLDALCRRFDISLESRTLHGALLDAQLLSQVYLELCGGRVRSFEFDSVRASAADRVGGPARQRPRPLPALLSEEERAAHGRFVEKLGGGALWARR